VRAHNELFLQRTVERAQTVKSMVRAQIGVPGQAQLAYPTVIRRVHGHTLPQLERLMQAIKRALP